MFAIPIHSLRFKLIASLFAVSLLIGLVSLLVGGNLIYRSVLDEANRRIRQDLSSARVIYDDRIDAIKLALDITADSPKRVADLILPVGNELTNTIARLSQRLRLDFAGITDAHGYVVFKTGAGKQNLSRRQSDNPLVTMAIETQQPVYGTVVLNAQQMKNENPLLARGHTTPHRNDPENPEQADHRGMAIGAAVPVYEGTRFQGVIYAGTLLNNADHLVDKIMDTVFENETYKGRNLGTATIFYQGLRIATSVKDRTGKRALGTTASSEVVRTVLDRGIPWTDRARVLDEWYVTAYEPITDIYGERVGMLYVGVLEQRYRDVRRNAIAIFTAITFAGVAAAVTLGWLFTGRIMRPVSYLVRASQQISKGNLCPDIGPVSKGGIGILQEKFLSMAQALRQREERQKAESEFHLMQSQKQASIGRLAAGVAHEINNPLTAVLTFTHLTLQKKDLAQDIRSDLEMVASQTERVRSIVKSLLDFSRQTEIAPESLDLNRLISDCVRLMENQALIKGVDLSFEGEKYLPRLILDKNQIQSVMVNMILNALDATAAGGRIRITTQKTIDRGNVGARIDITDTGCGIAPEHMHKLFDPFFTTKEVGKGTGLGLAVSAGIIQRHGGTVDVRSTPGKGSVFTIYLPDNPNNGPADEKE